MQTDTQSAAPTPGPWGVGPVNDDPDAGIIGETAGAAS